MRTLLFIFRGFCDRLGVAPPNSRSTARSKLTRLTVQQFHELSTDVYDELVRRKNENEGISIHLVLVVERLSS